MLNHDLRQTICYLHETGSSRRAISRLLKLSRNTVREALAIGADIVPVEKQAQLTDQVEIVRELFTRCGGNAIRIQEILKSAYDIEIAYSTLTRLVQRQGLRKSIKRVGDYQFEPGVEMQHDTSPHRVMLGDTVVKAQCASLVL